MLSFIKQNFGDIDKDKNNKVSFDELKENLEEHGIEFEGDIQWFFDAIDLDHDGQLSIDEIMDQSMLNAEEFYQ